MKCIYLMDVFKNKRCGKNAFGLLGGNSYCKEHLDVKQAAPKEPAKQETPRYYPPSKSFHDSFREMYGREPNKWELNASI